MARQARKRRLRAAPARLPLDRLRIQPDTKFAPPPSTLLDLISPVHRNTSVDGDRRNESNVGSTRMNISSGKEISIFFFPSSDCHWTGRAGKINYSSRIGREKVVIIRGKYKLNTRREVYQPPLPPLPASLLLFRSPAGALHRLVLSQSSAFLLTVNNHLYFQLALLIRRRRRHCRS